MQVNVKKLLSRLDLIMVHGVARIKPGCIIEQKINNSLK